MQQEEIKKSKKLFPMKTIHIKNANEVADEVNNPIETLDFELNQLFKKTEEIIIAYLERIIYTSNLSNATTEQIQTLFNTIKAQMIQPN